MTTLAAPTPPPETAAPALIRDSGERFVLNGVSWDVYERLVADLDASNDRTRLTYDDGMLELEMPGTLHEILIQIVSRMLESYLRHVNVPYMPLGQMTWKRGSQRKGLEADACYYIQNVSQVEALLSIDLEIHPPPDLAIEAEVTRPLIPKLAVYASLGIQEVWHIREDLTVRPMSLVDGHYVQRDVSLAVPALTPDLLHRFLKLRATGTHFETLRLFESELTTVFGPAK